MSKISPEQVTTALTRLGITIKDGKVNKQEVIAALDKLREATASDKMESGHLTEEKHDKVLEAVAEWREYIDGYNQEENKTYREMALKALDCATHCLSMAADACKELKHDEDEIEEVEEVLEDEIADDIQEELEEQIEEEENAL